MIAWKEDKHKKAATVLGRCFVANPSPFTTPDESSLKIIGGNHLLEASYLETVCYTNHKLI